MNKTILLDANLLISLAFTGHIHHDAASEWFASRNARFSTCPITQGALVRYALRNAPGSPIAAKLLLEEITALEQHVFWPNDIGYAGLAWPKVFGHGQVTDAYLVALAEHHDGVLATFDKSLAAVFPEALLVET